MSAAVLVLLGLPSLGSAQKVPVDSVLLGSRLYHPSPNLLGSKSHLRYPEGSPPLREVLPVVTRREGPHLIQELLHLICEIHKDRNYLFGYDRMLGKVGVEELGFVDHVSGMSDVHLQFLVEGEGEVELIQRLPVCLLLLS